MKTLCQVHPDSEEEILTLLRSSKVDARVISRLGTISSSVNGAYGARKIDIGVPKDKFVFARSLLDEYYKRRGNEIEHITEGVGRRLGWSMLVALLVTLACFALVDRRYFSSPEMYGWIPFVGFGFFLLVENIRSRKNKTKS